MNKECELKLKGPCLELKCIMGSASEYNVLQAVYTKQGATRKEWQTTQLNDGGLAGLVRRSINSRRTSSRDL